MKKKLIGFSIAGVISLILGFFGFKKLKKAKSVAENLTEKDLYLMNQIITNQKKLSQACDRHEELTIETEKLLNELKIRLNEKEIGIDPNDIDTSLEGEEI